MTDADKSAPDSDMVQAVWKEARDLIKRLEGSTVQRFAVQAGDYRIEIERGSPAPMMSAPGMAEATQFTGPVAGGAGPGPGVSPGARVSGVFPAIGGEEPDNRIPVLAPLVGTFYGASKPGADAFVKLGDVVEPGQTLCIVEAMKLMNEVQANEGGKVAEILCEDGQWVEFEQVLMYLEPAED
jgi:acetyl-CoA carboxylase biotin carboxyl carrier protein